MSRQDEASTHFPAGPLAVEWLGCELPELRAGVEARATVVFRNAGTVVWRPPDESERGIWLSFHWLDRLGNAIVWEGQRAPLTNDVNSGEEITLTTAIRGPIPHGPYRIAFDLVDEGRCWFADVGNEPLKLDVDVRPRLLERTLSVEISAGDGALVRRTQDALERQDEPLVDAGHIVAHLAAGCAPTPTWSRRVLDAHDEGYAAVGGSIRLSGARLTHRATRRSLAPWTAEFGRKPNWNLPLVCPSMAPEIRNWIPLGRPVSGLPAIDLADYVEPWVCDGRIVLDVPIKAVQPADRRRVETPATRS